MSETVNAQKNNNQRRKEMKRLFILAIVLALMAGVAYSESELPPLKFSICPKTLMRDSCLTCHAYPSFVLKEIGPNARYDYPVAGMKITDDVAYYVLSDINATEVQRVFDYVLWHPVVRKIIIEVHSPGGSLFDAYKIVGMMQHMMSLGYTIETRVYGFAASAGFMVAASGSNGHRFVSPTAELMWHELMSFSLFSIDTPSDSEEKARVLRHLQDTANEWLAKVSKMTLVEINDKIRKREFWMNGSQAIKYGFADGELR